MRLRHIAYRDLTAKQREIYNFQKVASLLAESLSAGSSV